MRRPALLRIVDFRQAVAFGLVVAIVVASADGDEFIIVNGFNLVILLVNYQKNINENKRLKK